MNKITWFLSHPIQYFSPLLKELGKKTDLSVYYYSDSSIKGDKDKGFGVPVKWDTDLLSGYKHGFVRNYAGRKPLNNRFWDVFNPGVIQTIWKQKGAVVIVNGWSYSSDLMVIFFSRVFGRQVWLRAENPLNQELKKTGIKLIIKRFFLKNFLFRVFINKCLNIGTENRKFFEFYGVSSSRLVYTPYAVDNNYFSSRARELKDQGDEIKNKLGLPADKKFILYSGKYIPKKNPMDLLKAYQSLNDDRFALVMVGEGELRKQMEQYILENNLKHVYLTGFVNQSEIPSYYSVADVFVMCSGMGETWGLSVNEAMNFGKPVIVSDTTGSSSDLVKQGQNGFVFREGDIQSLAGYIREILENDAFRIKAGSYSAEIIRDYSIENVTENIKNQLAGVKG